MVEKGMYRPENVEQFRIIIIRICTVIDAFSKEMISAGISLNLPQKVANKLLLRTRSNLEAIICLLDVYKEQTFIFHSIAHIYRTLLVDFLNFCYLMSFHDSNELSFSSFKNEYDFFNRDYLNALLEMDELEKQIPQECPMYNYVNKSEEKRSENLVQLKTFFAHLFRNDDITQKLKTAEELRATSKNNLFENNDVRKSPKESMLSEKYKFRRILRSSFKEYADIFIYYKYFTQQHHFSDHSNLHAGQNSSDENYHNLVWCTFRILDFVKFQIQIIVGDDRYEESILKIKLQMENCIR
ncbi:hypothetical protein [Cognataquiflexum rubidum]|uniref:hypothetical protein n=1 Tax=Cognataquiflexum rubidum TaxID=2922273 RepID=UPI001F148DE6|nr:hypothetical protein [Cognataquiflexum rubidum]MCH6233234.1 hypothetical protein [Cognataquiflexum rubidum]